MIPNDPFMLVSYLNLKLRDEYDSLESLADDLDIDKNEIEAKLSEIGYTYFDDTNSFRRI